MNQQLCRFGSISFLTYLLVILFGISSWVDINGLWVELPILVQNLPEGWDLPSYMAVIIQIANIAPFVYTVATKLWPHRLLEIPVIYTIISVGVISCLLMSFFWDYTTSIAGVQHSTALLVLQFFLALLDCTSSLAFLAFMSQLKSVYMSAYFIGEGFSGLVPSLIALGQGAGDMECVRFPLQQSNSSTIKALHNNFTEMNLTNESSVDLMLAQELSNSTTLSPSSLYSTYPIYQEPKFSVKTFFLILMMLLISSGISFTLLNYWSYCKKDHVPKDDDIDDGSNEQCLSDTITDDLSMTNFIKSKRCESQVHSEKRYDAQQDSRHILSEFTNGSDSNESSNFSSRDSVALKAKKILTRIPMMKYCLFLFLTAWLNALSNGVLPSLQTYSCLPYGIQPYHLSVTLSQISNPVACFATMFVTVTSIPGTLIMTLIGTCIAAYVILTAALSPEPPLVGDSLGTYLVILAWVLVIFIITFTKVSIATLFRSEGKKALLWIGVSTQVGSLCGALVTFLLVNVYKLFEVANPCG